MGLNPIFSVAGNQGRNHSATASGCSEPFFLLGEGSRPYACTCMCTCMCISACIYMCECGWCAYIVLCVHAGMCVCAHVCACIHVCACSAWNLAESTSRRRSTFSPPSYPAWGGLRLRVLAPAMQVQLLSLLSLCSGGSANLISLIWGKRRKMLQFMVVE